MANFSDLATELQIAIWQLALPYRGMHWIEIEGLVHEASYIRDSLRITREYGFGDNVPESTRALWNCLWRRPRHAEDWERAKRKSDVDDYSGRFFSKLLAVVPAVWGSPGPSDDQQSLDDGVTSQVAKELAHTRRCRELSTYTVVATLLSTCQLSRAIAMHYVKEQKRWPIYRSMGALHRTRPLDVWEEQYRNIGITEPEPDPPSVLRLVPAVRFAHDLVVFRLHDSEGRATATLRQGPWQFHPETRLASSTLPWFSRVALEWHPRWAEPGPDGFDQFRAGNVSAIFELLCTRSRDVTMLYWLVDGIPKPNWKRDYPTGVESAFSQWNAKWRRTVLKYNLLDRATKDRLLADCDLDLEFNANGRRYYIVFVVIPLKDSTWYEFVEEAAPGMSFDGPFLGGEEIWPEKLRAPARFAHEMLTNYDELYELNTHHRISFILSWEPL